LSDQTHIRWSAWWPFALLCLLAATRWALTEAFPTSTTTLLSASTGCAAAALVSLLFYRSQLHDSGAACPASGTWVRRISAEPRILFAGALLLSGPLASLLLTGHGTNPNNLTLALALVPIVAVIAQTAFDHGAPGSFAAHTWPALAAIAGLLLIIPQPSLADPVTDATLLLAPLATGIGAALFSTSSSPRNQPELTSALGAAAFLFAVVWVVQFFLHLTTAHLSPVAAFLDAATAILTLLSLRHIGLTRWSAQFVLIPFLVILQGLVLLHPPMDAHNSTGLALLLIGSIFLLLPQPTEKAP